MRDDRGKSDHDVMRDEKLPDWGFWSRHNADKPDNQRGLSSGIYLKGKRDERESDADIWVCVRCRRPSGDPSKEAPCEQCPTDRPEWLHIPHQAPEAHARKIDERECDRLDGFIDQLPALHKQVIVRAYYKGIQTDIQDKDAAVRSLLDLMAANRKVVDVMKRFRWD